MAVSRAIVCDRPPIDHLVCGRLLSHSLRMSNRSIAFPRPHLQYTYICNVIRTSNRDAQARSHSGVSVPDRSAFECKVTTGLVRHSRPVHGKFYLSTLRSVGKGDRTGGDGAGGRALGSVFLTGGQNKSNAQKGRTRSKSPKQTVFSKSRPV